MPPLGVVVSDPMLALLEQVAGSVASSQLAGEDPLESAVSGAMTEAESPVPIRIPPPGRPPILPTMPIGSAVLGGLAGIQTVLAGRQAAGAEERAGRLKARLALAPLVGITEARRTQAGLSAARLREIGRHNQQVEGSVRDRVRLLGQALKLDPALKEAIMIDLAQAKEIETDMNKTGTDPGPSYASAFRTLQASPSPEAVDQNLSTWLGIVARENPDASNLLQVQARIRKSQLKLNALEAPATQAAGRGVSRGTSSRPAAPSPRAPSGRASPATTGLQGVE